MSMVVVRFTRLPTPPLTINSSNAHDYTPWYEALQTKYHSSATEAWSALSSNIVSAIHNHYRHYQYWNYKICKMEILWKLGRGQNAPQILYEYAVNDEYLELHEGQHERIVAALALQNRASGDFMAVEYMAGSSSQGQVGLVSFMELEKV
ncbi:uncharacterized protein EAF01_000077 [Botrytis porri]|uniref:Uncharacterized protein n=1 Tax=Botrytis porri TaxID=87229 RepID=A0A4Z1K9J4_9HELO|nr:uncharacterized protein EAF01_000077 [Botrytis porri]KAF7913671.1 hypothetical protein EAF01_000077 [Botrytis porri]TGO82783.1 hypothetical protein BPOR_0760g00050 [Botrytis porri]